MIKKRTGEDIDLNGLAVLRNPEAADPDVMQGFRDGYTIGVFQFGSKGITSLIKEIIPDSVLDLAAANALYRPGPMKGGVTWDYAKRKHGRQEIDHWHESIESIMAETYGIVCIHENTRIGMADGTEKLIKDLRVNELVDSWVAGKHVTRQCLGAAPTRVGDGLAITASDGTCVVLTPDHQLMTRRGLVRADSLRDDDLIAKVVDSDRGGLPLGEYWLGSDVDVSYLIGQLVGDGCLTSAGVCISTGTSVSHELFMSWLKLRLPSLHAHPYFHTRSWYVGISHPLLANVIGRGNRLGAFRYMLERHGMGVIATKKRIPIAIMKGSKEVKLAFLAGLIDSDGGYQSNKSKVTRIFVSSGSSELLRDVARLAQTVGLGLYSIYETSISFWCCESMRKALEPYLVCKRSMLSGEANDGDTVGFVHRDEIRSLAINSGMSFRKFAEDKGISRISFKPGGHSSSSTGVRAGIVLEDTRYMAIRSIETVCDQKFYGMSVEDTNLLVANGLVIKNCYQEQVMRISQRIGGFSAAEADDLRKAMGKLYRLKGGSTAREFMKKYEIKWFKGAAKAGISKKVADEIWHKILQFGSYGFNKSHSASYALQAYQDMWLKIKYPLEFYCALLTYEKDENKRISAMREAKTRGIKILPPSVQKSDIGWSADPKENGIRVGLKGISGLGPVAATYIVKDRETYGRFASLEDFASRVSGQKVNTLRIDALRESGALDAYGVRDGASGSQLAEWEKARLNMVLSVTGAAEKYSGLISSNIYTQDEVVEAENGTRVVVGGEITKIDRKKTKKGKDFANVSLFFQMNEWRVRFWSEKLVAYESILHEGSVIMVSGTKEEWNGFISVIASDVTDIESLADSQKENV